MNEDQLHAYIDTCFDAKSEIMSGRAVTVRFGEGSTTFLSLGQIDEQIEWARRELISSKQVRSGNRALDVSIEVR